MLSRLRHSSSRRSLRRGGIAVTTTSVAIYAFAIVFGVVSSVSGKINLPQPQQQGSASSIDSEKNPGESQSQSSSQSTTVLIAIECVVLPIATLFLLWGTEMIAASYAMGKGYHFVTGFENKNTTFAQLLC